MDTNLQDVMSARLEGRNDDALRLLTGRFEQLAQGAAGANDLHFITMFTWRQLAEEYPPARAALRRASDEQTRRLLDGEEIFGSSTVDWPISRFRVIVDMNETLCASMHRTRCSK